MHIHIIAVSGTGMGALAGLLKQLGHEVSGSDIAFDPPMGPALERWGVHCRVGFDPSHLEPKPDLVVVGNFCRRDNPLVQAVIERGIPYTHIAGALQRFALAGTSPLVITGTHGKTTTSAMAAWLLDHAGKQPGFLIGGIPKNFDTSFRKAALDRRNLPTAPATPGLVQRRPPFVIEGDEYDTAFFEKTAKFLHYQAEVAIVTSIEHDHIDIYPSFEAYAEAFSRFVAQIPEQGLIIANAADPNVVRVVESNAKAPVSWFALSDEDTGGRACHFLGAPANADATGTSFDVYAGGVACGRFAIPSAGRHNLKNALAALAACAQGYGVPLNQVAQGLATFKGVRRRQDLLGTPGGVFVYDDFAHHPTAVLETLKAFKAKHPGARLFAVFEPRSATACRNLHQQDYVNAFLPADEVLLAPLGRPDLPEHERLNTEQIARELRDAGRTAASFSSLDALLEHLVSSANSGSVVALLSNGAFGGIHERLLRAIEARAI